MADKSAAAAVKKVKKNVHPPQRSRSQKIRLYARARFTGFTRSKVNQNTNAAILKIEGVKDTTGAAWYLGKRCAFVYRVKAKKNGMKGKNVRVIYGRVARPHGTSGAVRARFVKNLPASAMGSLVRVMLYPSRV